MAKNGAAAAAAPAEPTPPDNLRIWDALFRTDPAHVKAFNRGGGFKGSAIKPMYSIRKATEFFGPIGIGWGIVEHEARIETLNGAPTCFIKASVWYVPPGDAPFFIPGAASSVPSNARYAGPQWGGTVMLNGKDVEIAAGKGRADDEAFKKSLTDAVTKCLSYLGIGGDVHMGQFDDSKYVEDARAVIAAEADAKIAAKIAQADIAWVDGAKVEVDECQDLDQYEQVKRTHFDRYAEIRGRNPDLARDYANYMAKTKGDLRVKAGLPRQEEPKTRDEQAEEASQGAVAGSGPDPDGDTARAGFNNDEFNQDQGYPGA